jgi:homoserine dehydrogenase
VSVKSVVQKGLSEGAARMVMVVHRVPEARFYAAMARIAELEPVRARPRAIRVVEEQFG